MRYNKYILEGLNKNSKILVYIIIIIFVMIISAFYVYSDTSSPLVPIADGGNDSADWKNTLGNLCNSVSCYTEVDEATGSDCGGISDGDTSYVSSKVLGAIQTFDINESSIPDGATITQIAITACAKLTDGIYQTRYCHNGSCTNSGINVSTGASYAATTQNHSVNIVKDSSTDIEIGFLSNSSKDKRISSISAVLTYTVPGGGGGSSGGGSSVEVTSGGGNNPTKIIFSGKAFPGARASIRLVSDELGDVTVVDEIEIGDDARFYLETISPVEEERLYGLIVKDRDGNAAKSIFFQDSYKFNTTVRYENLILAPTIEMSQTSAIKGELVLISGYAVPRGKVELLVDGEKLTEMEANSEGRYQIVLDSDDVELGRRILQTRQTDFESGLISDVSQLREIEITSFRFAFVDFNQDGEVDIGDWSIFLSNWFSTDNSVRLRSDLNGDGLVNVSDFSIFLKTYQLSTK